MNYNDLMKQGMTMSMDELENTIEVYKKSYELLNDIKVLRNRTGEMSTKQVMAQRKREQKKAQKQAQKQPQAKQPAQPQRTE